MGMFTDSRQAVRKETDSWLIAIDTSTERAGVALTNGTVTAEVAWEAGRTQTTTLVETMQWLMRRADVRVSDLAAVAVAIGPGTFNGLRAGIGTAKGLVLGADLPLIGVPTLDATALPFAQPGNTVVAVVSAGRERVVWSAYVPVEVQESDMEPQLWRNVSFSGWQASEPVNGTWADMSDVLRSLTGSIVVAGDVSDGAIEANPDAAAGSRIWLPPPVIRQRRPAAVAAIGWDRHTHGLHDDPALLSPLYVHGKRRV